MQQWHHRKNLPLLCSACFILLIYSFSVRSFAQTIDRTDSPVGQISAKADATTDEILTLYCQPPREYATSPLWVWNDLLSEEQIRDTLNHFADQGVKQVFVHPRPGLMTSYLSDDWFRLWRVALDEAEKLDMNIWIYDENSYPSGFAGGFVPEEMPEARGYGLAFNEMREVRGAGDNVLSVWRMSDDNTVAEDVTQAARTADGVKDGKFLVISVNRAGNGGWYANRCYVDLMDRNVTDKFIQVTLEAYKKNVGDQFGKRVLGIFTDEPQIIPAGLPWTPKYFEEFQARRGYDLHEHMPSITRPVGDWKKTRYDYYKTNHELFVQNWAKPYYEWCESNGVAFTGHYWDHDFPNLSGVPDSMTMAAWQQIPGIDCLMNQYSETTNSQFGNIRFCKEISSIAKQYGRQRVLCEAYGAGGWDLRFEDMKRIADWLIVNGVNLFDEHLSYVTLRGARKADHPQSFSYHEPWWNEYRNVSTYIQRLCAVLSQGITDYDIVVLEPTGTSWMLQGTGENNEMAKKFFDQLLEMSKRQIEYDLGAENTFGEIASISERNGQPTFVIGKGNYSTVIIPDGTETLESQTVTLLKEFLQKGGRVISIGALPDRIDGAKSDEITKLAEAESWIHVENTTRFFNLAQDAQWASPEMQRLISAGDSKTALLPNVYHMRRKTADGEILFIVNTSLDQPTPPLHLSDAFSHAKVLDPLTGTATDTDMGAMITLPPAGSLLLVRKEGVDKSTADEISHSQTWQERLNGTPVESSPITVRRIAPNVLTLDYCDLQTKNGTYDDIYYNKACGLIWANAGMGQNPWDSQVQFKRELIDRVFPDDSGFTVSYRFTIDGDIPSDLAFVLERPDLYEVSLNGQKLTCPVAASNEKDVAVQFQNWWLDRAFGKMDISKIAKRGENIVTCTAKKMTFWHEIQAAFIIGDFSLVPRDKGFAIVPSQPLEVRTEAVTHKSDREGVSWLTSGIDFRPGSSLKNDDAPWIEFTFTKPVHVRSMAVWNYNEAPSGEADLTRRGIKRARISVSRDGETWTEIGEQTFSKAAGTTSHSAEIIPLNVDGIQKIRFDILENYMGLTYPVSDEAKKEPSKMDHAFVGLSEIRFYDQPNLDDPQLAIPNVLATASSELVVDNHNRCASMAIDGSGFTQGGIGWNRQGLPFYADGVTYTRHFTLGDDFHDRTYTMNLRPQDWFGSTLKWMINGQEVGWAAWTSPQFDLTPYLQAGENTIELTIIGTLRNTLGPLHSGSHQFSAWPGMFHQAPEHQPAGSAYGTLDYGLFHPFTILVTSRIDAN